AHREVLLVEAGGVSVVPENAALVRAEYVGRPLRIPVSRCIEVGGTSNQWHGICGTLDPEDFAPRPAMGSRGWPIGSDDLQQYYMRAAELLGVHGTDESLDDSSRRLFQDRSGDIHFNRTLLDTKLVFWRRPPKRWKRKI